MTQIGSACNAASVIIEIKKLVKLEKGDEHFHAVFRSYPSDFLKNREKLEHHVFDKSFYFVCLSSDVFNIV